MLNISFNDEVVKSMLQSSIDKRLDELAKEKYFMTFKDLAEYVSLSRPTIEDRLLKNGMKYYKQGSKYLFKRDEVDAFLDDMTASLTASNNDIKFFNNLKKGSESK